MADTITIAGKTFPKTYLMAGGAAVAGIVAYAYFKNGSGEEEIVDPGLLDDMGDERITPTTVDSSQVHVDNRTGYKTDQEWYQAAIDILLNNYGVGSTPIAAAALNNYLGSKDMTKEQIDMLHFVLNTISIPPSGQKPLRLGTAPAPTPSQTGRATPGAVGGLKATATRSQITASWNKAANAGTYRIDLIKNINDVIQSGRVTGTSWKSGVALKPNSPYRIKVWGVSNQNVTGPSTNVNVRTKA